MPEWKPVKCAFLFNMLDAKWKVKVMVKVKLIDSTLSGILGNKQQKCYE